MLAMSAAVFARRQAVCETSFYLPSFRLSEKMVLLVFPSRQCEFACPVSSFLWAVPFQAGGTCLLQNMDFSCCLARGGIEPPLLAERRFTSCGCSPELRTMRKGLALAVFLLFLVFGRVLRRVMCRSRVRYV